MRTKKFTFDPEQLKRYLSDPENTPIRFYPSVTSTNTLLKQTADAPNLQVILAEHQRNGRGRLGRGFYSPASTGVYLSILYHQSDLERIPYLTMAAGVCAYTAIREVFDIETALKWVNDLYLDGRKIGGILAESVFRSASQTPKAYTVLGIGINLFEPESGFPAELQNIAGALFPSPDDCPPEKRYAFIAVLIDKLRALDTCDFPGDHIDIYKQHSLVLGKKVKLICGNETQLGIVRDFDQWGHLIFENENGDVQTVAGGEISLRMWE